jgi:2-iminobutanoate/2-iminopropanoate deaminase
MGQPVGGNRHGLTKKPGAGGVKSGKREGKGGLAVTGQKKVVGDPLVIGGRKLSLSRAIRAGDTVYLTGQIPMQNGQPMTTGTIEDQTRAVLDDITRTLAMAGCTRDHVVKAMVWLRERADFPGFNAVYADYFPHDPPARSAIVSDLLVDCRVEIEVVAWHPLP